jgi:hypothetical protein
MLQSLTALTGLYYPDLSSSINSFSLRAGHTKTDTSSVRPAVEEQRVIPRTGGQRSIVAQNAQGDTLEFSQISPLTRMEQRSALPKQSDTKLSLLDSTLVLLGACL